MGRTNPEIIDAWVALYEAGMSFAKIALQYGVNNHVVSDHLRERGIKTRPKGYHSRKYTVGYKDAFKSLDNEQSAYWFGFLSADGCVDKGRRVRLLIHKKDLNHLVAYKNFLKTDYPICYRKSDGHPSLDVICRELAEDLTEKGCTPRKSLTLQFPNEDVLPREFLWDYLRGVFDGDGCITTSKRADSPRSWHPMVSFATGSTLFAYSLATVLGDRFPSTVLAHPTSNHSAWNVRVVGYKNLEQLYPLFYDNATVWLPRKRVAFEEYLKRKRPVEVRHRDTVADEVVQSYIAGENMYSIAKRFNIGTATVHRVLVDRGVSRKDTRFKVKHDHEGIIKDYLSGERVADIVHKYGLIDNKAMYQILRQCNVPARRFFCQNITN